MKPDAPEGLAVPAPLVTLVVLLFNDTKSSHETLGKIKK
jgi:hypothetical protein